MEYRVMWLEGERVNGMAYRRQSWEKIQSFAKRVNKLFTKTLIRVRAHSESFGREYTGVCNFILLIC